MIKPPALTDELAQRILDYINAGTMTARGRHGFRIPSIVAGEWAANGYAVLQTNTLARRLGVQRKTMWRTIANCIEDGFIREIGRTDDGRAMYEPCLEKGDECRRQAEVRAHG